eukprot:TRINITY_DN1968_c0_g1_i2.p1 TRINITY_DN1968_c0_g1~~TRINITY_DN1968_c0_g1_i2.p1  ORF type:complete len:174 (-),score=51.60 TRINITY_DN1968_c0_g1_i2:66-587(-)
MSLYSIKSVMILDSEGERICAHYYSSDFPTMKEQRAFEKTLLTKTKKVNGEVFMWENTISVYKNSADVYFYVVGGYEENELILSSVLNALYDAISTLLKNQIDKRTLLENLDYILLALDELVDQGIILEADPAVIANRVSMRGAEAETPLADQTLSQALGSVKEQFFRSFLRG